MKNKNPSKTNLKENIFIEGFDSEHEFRTRLYGSKGVSNSTTFIYQGKTSDIPEELAKECVEKMPYDITNSLYRNYLSDYWKHSAKESIESACNQEYCVIYKTKI